MKQFHKKFENGFTMIEIVIAIFILSLCLVAILSAFSVVTILTSDSADRLTGAYLAQEGMEIVRNIRDTNWLDMDFCASNPTDATCISNPPAWATGLTTVGACGNTITGCEADYTSASMSGNSGEYLKIDDINGFYNYTSDTNTKFKRKIIIDYAKDAGNNPINYIIKVTVKVSWNEKATILNPWVSADNCCPDSTNPSCPVNVSNCVTTEETLYNWYYPNH
jgi:prepilin-type N-terminal cleavage/methylation domain-containing protein